MKKTRSVAFVLRNALARRQAFSYRTTFFVRVFRFRVLFCVAFLATFFASSFFGVREPLFVRVFFSFPASRLFADRRFLAARRFSFAVCLCCFPFASRRTNRSLKPVDARRPVFWDLGAALTPLNLLGSMRRRRSCAAGRPGPKIMT